MISTNPAWQPEETEMMQRVYRTVLLEDWFDRTSQNERDFARIVIGFFQRGITDEDLLFTESLGVARSRFSAVKVVHQRHESPKIA